MVRRSSLSSCRLSIVSRGTDRSCRCATIRARQASRALNSFTPWPRKHVTTHTLTGIVAKSSRAERRMPSNSWWKCNRTTHEVTLPADRLVDERVGRSESAAHGTPAFPTASAPDPWRPTPDSPPRGRDPPITRVSAARRVRHMRDGTPGVSQCCRPERPTRRSADAACRSWQHLVSALPRRAHSPLTPRH